MLYVKRYGDQGGRGGGGGGSWIMVFTHINAFVLDNNFCFFEHLNELLYVQICLTSLKELTMILNQN